MLLCNLVGQKMDVAVDQFLVLFVALQKERSFVGMFGAPLCSVVPNR